MAAMMHSATRVERAFRALGVSEPRLWRVEFVEGGEAKSRDLFAVVGIQRGQKYVTLSLDTWCCNFRLAEDTRDALRRRWQRYTQRQKPSTRLQFSMGNTGFMFRVLLNDLAWWREQLRAILTKPGAFVPLEGFGRPFIAARSLSTVGDASDDNETAQETNGLCQCPQCMAEGTQ